MSTEAREWETFPGAQPLVRTPFDRATFDPLTNPDDKASLRALRSQGQLRYARFRSCAEDSRCHVNCASTALRQLSLMPVDDGPRYVDLGCGHSPDVLIAASLGYRAVGLDLFPSVLPAESFMRWDVVESIPFPDGSVAVVASQAMIDLVEPEKRADVYASALRVLTVGGAFSQTGCPLHRGHGFDSKTEVERVRSVGFRAVAVYAYGFVAVK